MAKAKTTAFFCKECGYESAKWMGQCPACKEWNTFVEEPIVKKESSSSGKIRLTERRKPVALSEISIEEKDRISKECFFADYFLTSCNAITEDGIMVNIDGNGNRVAAIVYGPSHVIVITGMNKVVRTEEDALSRARNEAAPINAQRFGLSTPCSTTGECANCLSPETVCCQFLTTRYSKHKGRIKVILVNEDLGF